MGGYAGEEVEAETEVSAVGGVKVEGRVREGKWQLGGVCRARPMGCEYTEVTGRVFGG